MKIKQLKQRKMKAWLKIKCFFGFHNEEIFKSEDTRGMIFGGVAKRNYWRCINCGKDGGATMTETLNMNFTNNK